MSKLERGVLPLVVGVVCFIGGYIFGNKNISNEDYALIFREKGEPPIIKTFEHLRANDTYIQSPTDSTESTYIRFEKYIELLEEKADSNFVAKKYDLLKRLEEK